MKSSEDNILTFLKYKDIAEVKQKKWSQKKIHEMDFKKDHELKFYEKVHISTKGPIMLNMCKSF